MRRIWGRGYYWRNHEKQRARKHHPKVLARRRAQDKTKRLRAKLEAFDAYGGRFCACCGEIEIDFLSLDHVNGRKKEERLDLRKNPKAYKSCGYWLYKRLKREGWPLGFQVLCMNCNWGKRICGICPHKRKNG